LYSLTGKLKRLDEKSDKRQRVDGEDAAHHPKQRENEAFSESLIVRDIVVPYATA